MQSFSKFTTTDGVTHEIADAWLAMAPSLVTLKNGEVLNLSNLENAAQISAIDMATDTAANVVKLTLNDVLGMATTNGVHKLTLTGGENDAVQLVSGEWHESGNVVTEGGHTYSVYNANATTDAQLLIDQAILNLGCLS